MVGSGPSGGSTGSSGSVSATCSSSMMLSRVLSTAPSFPNDNPSSESPDKVSRQSEFLPENDLHATEVLEIFPLLPIKFQGLLVAGEISCDGESTGLLGTSTTLNERGPILLSVTTSSTGLIL